MKNTPVNMFALEAEEAMLNREETMLCDYCGEETADAEVHTSTGFDMVICNSCWNRYE